VVIGRLPKPQTFPQAKTPEVIASQTIYLTTTWGSVWLAKLGRTMAALLFLQTVAAQHIHPWLDNTVQRNTVLQNTDNNINVKKKPLKM